MTATVTVKRKGSRTTNGINNETAAQHTGRGRRRRGNAKRTRVQ